MREAPCTPPPILSRELSSPNSLPSRSPLLQATPLSSPLDRVQVYARCRPPSAGLETAIRVDGNTLAINYRDRGVAFTFDAVFEASATQEDVYAALAPPLLVDVLDGYEGAILAYGQTGSGKTYSLLNMSSAQEGSAPESDVGLFPRLAADIFTSIEADFRNLYAVEVAFFQVYNENVDDLLRPATNLRLLADIDGRAQVENLLWLPVRSAPALLEAFRNGRRRLVYAETVMNQHSSRSHAVLQLRITKTPRPHADTTSADTGEAVTQLIGRLSIVDLAGSERIKKTNAEGQRLKEATGINVSLLALGNVVAALAGKQRHIPYRDSVLTRLLEPCLGGHSRTLLLACVAPEAEHAGESIGSCEFASRAMRIATAPTQNSSQVVLTPQALAQVLGRAAQDTALAQHGQHILRLEAQLTAAEEACTVATAEATTARERVAQLTATLTSMEAELKGARDEVRHATAAREFFAAQAGTAEAQLHEAKACAAAQLAEERERTASAEASLVSEKQARLLLERQLADELQRGRDAAAEAAAAVARAVADASSARAAAASALDGLTSAWEDATAAHRTYQETLAADASTAAAAVSRLASQVKELIRSGEANSHAWLACAIALPKRGRNKKRYLRLFRYLHATRRLEWCPQLSTDGAWKGITLPLDCTATIDGGILTVVCAERTMDVLIESPPQAAWAAALLECLTGRMETRGGSFETWAPQAGPAPPPPSMPDFTLLRGRADCVN